MKFTVSEKNLELLSAKLLAVPAWENGITVPEQMKFGGEPIQKLLEQTSKEEKFGGELEKILFLPVAHFLPYQRLLLVGMGKQKDWDQERVRRFSAWAVRSAEKVSAESIVLDMRFFKKLPLDDVIHALVEGAELGAYKFLKYKTETSLQKMQLTEVKEIILCGVEKAKIKKVNELISRAQLYAKATMMARDLINEPAGVMTPKELLENAKRIAAKNKNISLKYFNREESAKMGMNAFLGVGAGSQHEPFFVHMTYKPKTNPKNKKIAIVGKGVTFDSGGLSLKPADMMLDMKIDMSGAANVLAVFSVLTQINPSVQIEGIFTAAENMPSGSAIKPGDVVKALNGKTIEVLNTDAEGRVCLADSLSYAVRLKPDAIFDFATLTGAAMVALGEEVSAAYTNDKKLLQKFNESCELEGEKVWEMPLIDDYMKKNQSLVADIKNLADNRWGGSITAALFLREFVSDIPWIHFDIAGPSGVWTQFHVVPYIPQGGTGFGVRSFLNFVERNY